MDNLIALVVGVGTGLGNHPVRGGQGVVSRPPDPDQRRRLQREDGCYDCGFGGASCRQEGLTQWGSSVGLVLGGGATYWLMRKLFHCGWLTSDWFDMQLRQIEGRLRNGRGTRSPHPPMQLIARVATIF